MADETKSATARIGAIDAPGANLAATPDATPPVHESERPWTTDPILGAPGPDPETPAAERIRAFEDVHLGAEAVRIGGRIERGSGSPFAAMDPEKKRQYAALEKLVEAEQKLAAAHAALIQADVEHDAALAAAELAPDAE